MNSVYIFLVLLIAVCCAYKAPAVESCPEENCVSADHCDSPLKGAKCKGTEKICCSAVKSGYRTHCRHHAAECMDWCGEDLRRSVVDKCPDKQMCCVLV